MAGADYLSCASCGTKTVYDAEVDYQTATELGRLHDIAAICQKCAETHSIQVVARPAKRISDWLE